MEGAPSSPSPSGSRTSPTRASPAAWACRIAVDKPEQVGSAWDQALAGDRPMVLDVRTDPSIPPIPPHATFEQAKDAAMALLKGDPDRWGVLKEGLMTKAREILPGRSE